MLLQCAPSLTPYGVNKPERLGRRARAASQS